jgi:hypothetical protein
MYSNHNTLKIICSGHHSKQNAMATPIEELRQACLDRGVHGIRMIGR